MGIDNKLVIFGVDDLIEGLIRLMNSDYTRPINIGNINEFTILELAELIRQKINRSLSIAHRDLPTKQAEAHGLRGHQGFVKATST